ncbi:hypothetical protein GP486_005106 [Trichoglossum hirsutum]|uniref:Uncharacterized protein n=1 Tax=Trichoglossum hirsutum TaxID=265104 RepID=A0A9P8L9P4_9PEZI|nr:hypothetical protein GP486_005106 [Trichoglossum hirsutum]
MYSAFRNIAQPLCILFECNTESCLLDNQAWDANDEAESVDSDSSNSSAAELTVLNQSDRELHQIMGEVTLSRQDRDKAASNESQNRRVPAWKSDRERLVARLPRPPQGPPFRAPVAVMYLTDDNGGYVPSSSRSLGRHKNSDELQITFRWRAHQTVAIGSQRKM